MTELENAGQSSEMQPWADLTFSQVSDNVYLNSSNIARPLRWKSRVAVSIGFEAQRKMTEPICEIYYSTPPLSSPLHLPLCVCLCMCVLPVSACRCVCVCVHLLVLEDGRGLSHSDHT